MSTTKSAYERKGSTLRSLRYPDDLIKAIHQVRGEESFSEWVVRQLWEAVKRVPKSGGE